MKIIHCGDLHLDSKMESNLSKEKAKERKNELLVTFSNMVDYASKNDVKVIIIAGDLFDTKQISAKAKNKVKELISENSNIDFLYLKGNHDTNSFISEMEQIPNNLKLFNDTWTSYQYGDVVISGTEIDESNTNKIYNSLILEYSKINIIVLHGQEMKNDVKDKTEIINLKSLKNKNIDYLALGHIHSYKLDKLDERGVYCYCGCLEGRGFDECGKKGFVLLNIEKNKIEPQFIQLAKRTFHEIRIDISNINSFREIESEIENKTITIPKEDLVKIILEGEADINLKTEIDIDYLLKKFDEFYFIKIYDETKMSINYKDYENDISLKGEYIRLVLNSKNTDEDKSKIIITGIKALLGEEII